MDLKLPVEQINKPPLPVPQSDGESPFELAKEINPIVKLLIQGDSGTGKTIAALDFPDPCVIDLEGGTNAYGGGEKTFHVKHTTTADAFIALVVWLSRNEHKFKTLVIDPFSVFYEALQTKWLQILMKRNKGSKSHRIEYYELAPKDWAFIKNELKYVYRLLASLDMHIVLICREKVKYKQGGFMQVDGVTFDGERSLPYIVDSHVRTFKDKDGEFLCEVFKDRSGILPKNNFPTDQLSQLLTGNLTYKPRTITQHITEKQISTLNEILAEYDQEAVKKSLAVFNVEAIEELTQNQATTIIAKCLSSKQ
jgi:hypothetical protein